MVQSEDSPSRAGEPTLAPAMAWRIRSTWRQRGSSGPAEPGAMGLIRVLLAAVGVAIVVARSLPWMPAPPIASRIEEAPPPPSVSKAEPVVPTAPPAPPSRPAPVRIVRTRSSGVALSLDPMARTLVLEERGAANAAGRRRVVLSERDDQAEDLSRPFKDTAISLPDVRRGDYVVVEMRGPEGRELERSVVVTLRPH